MFFSCKNNFKDIQQIGVLQNEPVGVADTINVKYTDSFQLKANLISSKMFDYSNRNFGFSEFPEGIELRVYDDEKNESKIFADYAIIYDETDLIDLRGNVILATYKQDSLFTSQMYYNQKTSWVFTNEAVRLVTETSESFGNGIDSDSEFNFPSMLEVTGEIEVNN